MTVGSILGEAVGVYRLLLRRSVTTAAGVYAVIALLDLAADLPASRGARFFVGVVAVALQWSGPVLVQGALVQIVRNVHVGVRPEHIGSLLERGRERFWSLLWASVVYGFGVVFGLILLVVPGLIVAARWSLMAPLIMLEDEDAGTARGRSWLLVAGETGPVLGAITTTFLLSEIPGLVSGFGFVFAFGSVGDTLLTFVWSSLTAPLVAHVLTVVYYRLVEPERPVIHESVAGWQSVWEGG